MKMKRVYAWLLALCMVFSMALTSVSAEEATEAPTEETGTQLVVEKLEGVESGLSLRLENGVSKEDFNISPEEEVRVIVVLEGESVCRQRCGLQCPDRRSAERPGVRPGGSDCPD